jgi:hypothetical protein
MFFFVGLDRFFKLFIPHVTDVLEEHQRQDVTLPVRTVHRAAAQNICGFPKVTFEGGESGGCHLVWVGLSPHWFHYTTRISALEDR